MFAGAFVGRLSNAEIFAHTHKCGVVCDKSFLCCTAEGLDTLFSGVIYNKKELGLADFGSDAEAISKLYQRKGASAFSLLDGSFVIIIRDGQQTIIVRDHHGAGSQVYYNDTCFCSSLADLALTQGFAKNVDYTSLATFLSVGYIPTGASSITGVAKLGAGHMLIYSKGDVKTINLFDTSAIAPAPYTEDLQSLSQQYGDLHAEAIRRRIGSSDNVGILLSGGYDSGGNLAALRKIYDGDIRSYSIGFKGDNWSELPLARCMSERFGTLHHEYEIDGGEIAALPEIVNHLGDPFVEGGLMVNYAAMRMVGGTKPDVILGGDGSDQYFGTSAREVAIHFLASKYGVKWLLRLLYNILSGEGFDKDGLPYKVRFHLGKILNILHGDCFGFDAARLGALLVDKSMTLRPEDVKPDTRSFDRLYLQHAYVFDLERIINQVILFKASKMAEMLGNKIAFPYMDLELYNFLQRVPVGYKCKGDSALSIAKGEGTAKFLLKYHYKPMLPTEITERKKQGGFAPMSLFFKDDVRRARIADFILSSSIIGDFLDKKQTEKFIKQYDALCGEPSGWFWYKQNRAIQYFNLLTAAIWWEQFIKSKRVSI